MEMTSTPSLQIRAAAKLKLLQYQRQYQRANDPAQYADPAAWIQANFYIPETNSPMQLYPSQIIPMREALSRDPDGKFRYSTVVWSAIKKSAKSSVAAALGLWMGFQRPYSSIKVIANDLKQADSRVAYYMRRAIELHPEWRHSCKVINYKITLPNKSIIEAIPIDPKGEAGANDDFVIYSELWGWKQDSAQRMWTETTLSPTKYGQSMRWCETYAGFSGESPVLESLYDQAVKNGECIDAENEIYKNGRLLVYWNTKPTLPWQTPEYYAQEAATLLEPEFNRIHRNAWGSSSSQFIPSEWWAACYQKILPEIDRLESWVIALDAAVSGDTFGLVAVTRRNGKTIIRHVRKWKAPKEGQIMYFGPPGIPEAQDESPAGEMRRLAKDHSIVKVVYDPYQLHSFCHQLKDELVVWFEEFQQTTKRLLADKQLRDDIREGKVNYADQPELTEHILNSNAQTEGDKLRIVKRSESGKIDLAVCLSMANYEATKMNLG